MKEYLSSRGIVVSSSGRLDRCPFCDGIRSASILDETIRCFKGSCKLGILGRNLSLKELIQMLENENGITNNQSIGDNTISPATATAPSNQPKQVNVEMIDKILREAIQFFHGELLDNQTALAHLVETRGRTMESIAHFKVGLIANTEKLYNRLKHSYSDDQLEESGLFKFDNNTEPRVPLYHGNYSYPVIWEGKIRNIKSKGEESCFISKEFSGEDYIRFFNEDVLNEDSIILVEGENDAMRLWELGHKNVVGTFGQLAQNQIEFIKKSKHIKTIYLCFDNDAPGENYTIKFIRAFARVTSKRLLVIGYL